MKCEVIDSVGMIYLDGRFDTTRVQELGNDIIDFAESDDVISIKVDMENLDYISSSGLRVMLQIAKLGKPFEVINVKPESYEIFSLSGFTDIMTVRQYHRIISIDDFELIRHDNDGVVYNLDDDKILKVYNKYVDEDYVDKDKATVKSLLKAGMAVMVASETVRTADGQLGVIFVK